MSNKRTRISGLAAFGIVVALILIAVIGCGSVAEPPDDTPTPLATPSPAAPGSDLSDAALAGKQVFNANCSACHGSDVMGSAAGPPLIDRIYEPGHHADFSIRNAVRNGVPKHHWWFGNMPPVAGITDQQVEQLICYIRELQLANGIFEEGTYSFKC